MSATLGESDANTFRRITNDAGRDDDPAWEPTPCHLNIAHTFNQGDAAPNIPVSFGFGSAKRDNCSDANGRALTKCYGCALCSLATMLTAFKGLEMMTPASLDALLRSVDGYGGDRADVNW